jgi:hypothetical protein
MRVSPAGVATGAIVCAIGRSIVLVANLGFLPVVFLLPSAFIGLLVGAIAGGMRGPVKGAIVGALLSAVVFELFMLPCASLLGIVDEVEGNGELSGDFLRETIVYCLEMGLAGAVGGGLGGFVSQRDVAACEPQK